MVEGWRSSDAGISPPPPLRPPFPGLAAMPPPHVHAYPGYGLPGRPAAPQFAAPPAAWHAAPHVAWHAAPPGGTPGAPLGVPLGGAAGGLPPWLQPSGAGAQPPPPARPPADDPPPLPPEDDDENDMAISSPAPAPPPPQPAAAAGPGSPAPLQRPGGTPAAEPGRAPPLQRPVAEPAHTAQPQEAAPPALAAGSQTPTQAAQLGKVALTFQVSPLKKCGPRSAAIPVSGSPRRLVHLSVV